VEGLELYIPGAEHLSGRPFQGRRGVYPLLFKPEHVGLILSGRKTQTRRVWKKSRAKVGAVHKAKTALFSPDHFALIRITGLRRERLGDIILEDIHVWEQKKVKETKKGAKAYTYYLASWRERDGSQGRLPGLFPKDEQRGGSGAGQEGS